MRRYDEKEIKEISAKFLIDKYGKYEKIINNKKLFERYMDIIMQHMEKIYLTYYDRKSPIFNYSDTLGHLIYWVHDGSNVWRYMDNDEVMDSTSKRRCFNCNKKSSKLGHDVCIKDLYKVRFACCGHNLTDAYAMVEVKVTEDDFIAKRNEKGRLYEFCNNINWYSFYQSTIKLVGEEIYKKFKIDIFKGR
jgi:hypothetical protein